MSLEEFESIFKNKTHYEIAQVISELCDKYQVYPHVLSMFNDCIMLLESENKDLILNSSEQENLFQICEVNAMNISFEDGYSIDDCYDTLNEFKNLYNLNFIIDE